MGSPCHTFSGTLADLHIPCVQSGSAVIRNSDHHPWANRPPRHFLNSYGVCTLKTLSPQIASVTQNQTSSNAHMHMSTQHCSWIVSARVNNYNFSWKWFCENCFLCLSSENLQHKDLLAFTEIQQKKNIFVSLNTIKDRQLLIHQTSFMYNKKNRSHLFLSWFLLFFHISL